MLQEAAPGEQVSTLQESKQLRTNIAQMKARDLEAAQQSHIDTQVRPSCLAAISKLAMRLALLRSFLPICSLLLCCCVQTVIAFPPFLSFASFLLFSLPCCLPAVR